jgi:hypothetical protein
MLGFHNSQTLERLSEVVTRLRIVFGIGWFFEWPKGRHFLSSTWPWADVKPSLLVLWGVCWMFIEYFDQTTSSRQPRITNLPFDVNWLDNSIDNDNWTSNFDNSFFTTYRNDNESFNTYLSK